ncbi:tetratricopeptide repeat protein [Tepidimonas sp. HKU79]|uniref:tetratricopeptide repeat protein n=1 Tax=Tepidimonas sp. HKU79 TaxID=3414505 RepID=UPI003C7CA70F
MSRRPPPLRSQPPAAPTRPAAQVGPAKAAQEALPPLERVKARLGLGDTLELSEALAAIRRALDQGWLFEAEVLARFILIQRPEEPNAWALRGEAALQDNDAASARLYFHEALRCLDELPSVTDTRRQKCLYWRAIAEANARLNRRELAEKALIEAARFDPEAKLAAQKSDIPALLNRAYPLILQNRLDEAEPLIRAVLKEDAANAAAWQGLAVLEHKRGRHEEALAAIDRAIELNPHDAGFWNNRGVLLKPLGGPRLAERIAAYDKAVALNPRFKEAYSNLADALTSARRFDEAEQALAQALALDPDYLGAKINRVNLMKAQERRQEALQEIEAILEQQRHPEALNLKGALLLETGEPHAAVAVLEESRALDGRNPSVLNNLGNAYLATARAAKAIECYRSAVLLAPGMAEAQANLALALLTQIQHGAPRGEYLALAKNHLKTAQELDPKLPQLFVAEGILKSQREHDREAARAAFEKALALQPKSVQALSGLASLYADMGERKKARELLKQAAQLAPDDADLMTSYIFALNYDPHSTPEEIRDAALAYGAHIQKRVGAPYTDWPNRRDPDKRLKVGFVSGDFRRHPVAYFTVGLFAHLPREAVEVYAYHNHTASDDMTARIQNAVDHWRVIAEFSTEAACELIRSDGIDVLIDLSGHTGYHRLDVFAKKPAPVQVTWLGFVTSTGLGTVDALLADAVSAPPASQAHYLERLVALPCIASLDLTPDLEAQLAPPPCLERGYVTFASFNNLIKMNEAVLALWARILAAVPQSRLLLKYRQFNDPLVKKRIEGAFAAHGIASERLILSGSIPNRREALEYWREADIALDPFPYNGATTTLETLFMGVPTITLRGDRFAGRMTAGYLTALGLTEWIASSEADYFAKAVALADDKAQLVHWRQALRARLLEALPGNPRAFAPVWLERVRALWREWCECGQISRPALAPDAAAGVEGKT